MPRSARRQPAARPEAIINAALEEFSEKGYAAARLDDVASKAGISKGLVYVYFKTKEELFKAVVCAFIVPRFEKLVGELEASPASAEDLLRGPIRSFLRGNYDGQSYLADLIGGGPALYGNCRGKVRSRHLHLVVLALRRCELENGELPADLQTLIPKWLEPEVLTSFDRPLEYDRDARWVGFDRPLDLEAVAAPRIGIGDFGR